MLRSLGLAAMALSSATSALSQKASENATRAAGDAFGTSVGSERIGLYSASDVRGFSPAQAGNIRIEGLSVTEHGSTIVFSGSKIRVGLTAQGYPFPAPTGIADYALLPAGDETVISPALSLGPNRTAMIQVDVQTPISRGTLSLGATALLRFDESFVGDHLKVAAAAGVLRWRPMDGVEIKPFVGRVDFIDDRTMPSIFTAGAFLPPKVKRRYIGLDWTEGRTTNQMAGAVGSAVLTNAWTIRAGLFRWDNSGRRGLFESFRNVLPDGSAQRLVVATRNQRAQSTSGELRSSHSLIEGPRRHIVHLSARGRDTSRRYGGADVRDLGHANIGRLIDIPAKEFAFGTLTRDDVRQLTAGIGYEGRWLKIGEASLGLQKSSYKKRTSVPGQIPLTSQDAPWLYNGTLALYLTSKLVAYAGYTRGLEESGIAPQDAVNRNEAPPPIRTKQGDAGVRYALTPKLSLVAGVFDVRKPYFNLDSARLYRQLGEVRHRGVELSLAGQPLYGLTVVGGVVLLDANVSGEAVDLGIIGSKPVGTAAQTVRLNLDYLFPARPNVSVDFGLSYLGERIASDRNFAQLENKQLVVPERATFDVGARYRFRVGKAPATLRAQITNLFNNYSWQVSSTGSFRFSDERRFLLSLAADL